MTRAAGATQAVVLSGGSAYAAYEVGVLTALLTGESPATGYQPLRPTIYTGTSAGSYNATFLVSRPEDDAVAVAELERIWSQEVPDAPGRGGNHVYRIRGDLGRFLDPIYQVRHPVQPFADLARDTAFFARDWLTRAVNFTITRAPLGRRLLELFDLSTVLDLTPYESLLRETVNLASVRESGKILRVATTNWMTGELRLFSNADMTDDVGYKALLASSAFPGLPPVTVLGEPYVDGGYVMNTPLSPAVEAGADELHVVYLDPDVSNIPLRSLNNTIDVMDKLYFILLATIYNRDVAVLRDIDRGLEVLEGAAGDGGFSEEETKAFLQLAGRMSAGSHYRKITLHRYHPGDDLGGVLGLLNFEADHIRGLIDRGFQDAVEHDCIASDCVLPG